MRMRFFSAVLAISATSALAAPAEAARQVVADGCSSFRASNVSASVSYDHESRRFEFLVGWAGEQMFRGRVRFEKYVSAEGLPKPQLFDRLRPLSVTNREGQRLDLVFGTKNTITAIGPKGEESFSCEDLLLWQLDI